MEFKKNKIDYLRIIGLIILAFSFMLKSLVGSLVVFALLILRDEVIRAFFSQKETKDLETLASQIEQIQIDLNTIKLDKAIRNLKDV